jgi:hypothetical protein
MTKRFIVVLALLFIAPAAAHAQSLFGTRGLGVPSDGYDARARALAINGVGLLGLSTSLVNPAEPAGTLRRGVTAAFQPSFGSVEFEGEDDDISATRFPLIRILYPTRLGVFSLGYSGVLDQSWAVIADGQEILGSDTVATRDAVVTVGGIGQLRLGFARRVTDRLAVGVAVGIYTGNIDRGITRVYPDSTLGFREFETHSRWDYSGPLAAVGMRFDAGADLRFGASLTWSGTLKAKPQEGSETEYQYDMPLRFAVGASGRVARNLIAAVSGSWTSWTSDDYRTPGNNTATAAEQQMEIGGGFEYQELRRGTRVFPLRLGVRTSKLPFHLVDEEAPGEWAITGGIGFRLVEDDFGPLAVADVGVERIQREGLAGSGQVSHGALKESFWRFTVSLSLFGR